MRKSFTLTSIGEMDRFVRQLIAQLAILSQKKGKIRRTALILALTGNLGTGKTTFTQYLLKLLGAKRKVVSPSFVLMRDYVLANGYRAYHLDAWRINAREFRALKLKELFRDPKNIILIEWAEKVRAALPKRALWLKFEHLPGTKRRVTLDQ